MKIDSLRLHDALIANVSKILNAFLSNSIDENIFGFQIIPLYDSDNAFSINNFETFDYDLSTTSGQIKIGVPFLVSLPRRECNNPNHTRGILVDDPARGQSSFSLLDITKCDCYETIGFIDDDTMKKLGTLLLNTIKTEVKNNWLKVRRDIVLSAFNNGNFVTREDQQIITTFSKIIDVEFDIFNVNQLRDIISQLNQFANAQNQLVKEQLLEVISGIENAISTLYFQASLIFSLYYATINSLPLVTPKCSEPSSDRFPKTIAPFDHTVQNPTLRNKIFNYVNKRFFNNRLVPSDNNRFLHKGCPEGQKQNEALGLDMDWRLKAINGESWGSIREFLIDNKLPVWPSADNDCNCDKCPKNYTLCTPELCVPNCCGGLELVRNTTESSRDDYVLNENDECHCECPEGYEWCPCPTLQHRIEKAIFKLGSDLERRPSNDEIADYLQDKYPREKILEELERWVDGEPPPDSDGCYIGKLCAEYYENADISKNIGFCAKKNNYTIFKDCLEVCSDEYLITGEAWSDYLKTPEQQKEEKFPIIHWYIVKQKGDTDIKVIKYFSPFIGGFVIDYEIKNFIEQNKSKKDYAIKLTLPKCEEGFGRTPPDCECASGSYGGIEPELPPGWILFNGEAIQMG